jgi:hypothetical protein
MTLVYSAWRLSGDYLRYIPDFYKEILQTWIKIGGGQTKTLSHFAEIRKQLIWGNKFIMF